MPRAEREDLEGRMARTLAKGSEQSEQQIDVGTLCELIVRKARKPDGIRPHTFEERQWAKASIRPRRRAACFKQWTTRCEPAGSSRRAISPRCTSFITSTVCRPFPSGRDKRRLAPRVPLKRTCHYKAGGSASVKQLVVDQFGAAQRTCIWNRLWSGAQEEQFRWD